MSQTFRLRGDPYKSRQKYLPDFGQSMSTADESHSVDCKLLTFHLFIGLSLLW